MGSARQMLVHAFISPCSKLYPQLVVTGFQFINVQQMLDIFLEHTAILLLTSADLPSYSHNHHFFSPGAQEQTLRPNKEMHIYSSFSDRLNIQSLEERFWKQCLEKTFSGMPIKHTTYLTNSVLKYSNFRTHIINTLPLISHWRLDSGLIIKTCFI